MRAHTISSITTGLVGCELFALFEWLPDNWADNFLFLLEIFELCCFLFFDSKYWISMECGNH
jgi:hypothetical protein